MKKITLLFASLLCVAYIAVAQLKLYVYQNDGTRTEFVASTVDSIAFSTITDSPDQPDDPIKPVDPTNGYEYVDLGLPSGTKWATCNVGADSPEEYGDYFAWGETTTKSSYNWSTYKWCNGRYDTQIKYCTSSSYGTVDNNIVLDLEDDAAYVNWGSSWRMPTRTEQIELRNTSYTTWTWTTLNGVKGYKVRSKINGNSIFLPAAGYRIDSDLYGAGSQGYYWSSSLNTDGSDGAYDFLYNETDYVKSSSSRREIGQSIRPVLCDEFTILYFVNTDNWSGVNAYVWIDGTSKEYIKWPGEKATRENITKYGYNIYSYNMYGKEQYNMIIFNEESSSLKPGQTDDLIIDYSKPYFYKGIWYKSLDDIVDTETDTANGHDYVDLGLPSGTKWATCNVGADSPEDYGDYFAWGETEPNIAYNWITYKWMTEGMFDWDGVNKYTIADGRTIAVWYNNYGKFIGDNKTTLDLSDDAAYTNWGTSWRMPTYAELKELKDNCTWTPTTQNGVNGYKVTSKTNGNSIFLPAAGNRNNSDLYNAGNYGSYWSRSLNTSDSEDAYLLYFRSDYVGCDPSYRYVGRSVRPVLAK